MEELIDHVKAQFKQQPKVGAMFEKCFTNTWLTTIKVMPDDTTFVVTGDIPAMWLRDSSAQVRPYLVVAEQDPAIADVIQGVIRRQLRYVLHDPYANAFNEAANGCGYQQDKTAMTPLVWERKYEVDSLCYPLQLAYLFWKATGRTSHLDQEFVAAARSIMQIWRIEQDHEQLSTYRFERTDCPPSDTLVRGGKGAEVRKTGMTWSGFRPSDDACQYGYLIPSNMFAVVVLRYLAEMADEVLQDGDLAAQARSLAAEIDLGIQTHATVNHPEFGVIYAYETDGFGNYNLMDDANVPSLLALPYIGYCTLDDARYQNTRRWILSANNPYYYEGSAARGIGSPHTPPRYVWHIALALQGMTGSLEEAKMVMETLLNTDAGTLMMHEGFHVDDPNQFTRAWFSWANMMYCEFVLAQCGIFVKGSPLSQARS
ncbi:MAG: glycoside hydrolase family 125 protein [Alicyclobacillus sp.]|nr:glycoside hydrolase family 125 protein [Alicyclobacillus sp.]